MNTFIVGVLLVLVPLLKATDVVGENSAESIIITTTAHTPFVASDITEHKPSLEINPVSFYMDILRSEASTKFGSGFMSADLYRCLRLSLGEAEQNLKNCYKRNDSQLMNCINSQMEQARKEIESTEIVNKLLKIAALKKSQRSN